MLNGSSTRRLFIAGLLLLLSGTAQARPSQGVYCALSVSTLDGKPASKRAVEVTFVVSSEAGATMKTGTLQMDGATLFESRLEETLNTYNVTLPESRRPDVREIVFSLNRTSLEMVLAFEDDSERYRAQGKCALIAPKI